MTDQPSQQPPQPQPPADRSVEGLLRSIEDFNAGIPDQVVSYYLQRSGFACPDARVRKLVALIVQKFIVTLSEDALQHCKKATAAGKDSRSSKTASKTQTGQDRRFVLTMEDLTGALHEHGEHLRKPEYIADRPAAAEAPPAKKQKVAKEKD